MSGIVSQAGASDAMPIVVVGLALGVALVLIYTVWALAGRRRAGRGRPSVASTSGAAAKARFEAGERRASLAAEQIERMVREQLGRYPDLAGTAVDFGTGSGGELEIWVGGSCYASVDEIPDPRIRQAVAEAVEMFNR